MQEQYPLPQSEKKASTSKHVSKGLIEHCSIVIQKVKTNSDRNTLNRHVSHHMQSINALTCPSSKSSLIGVPTDLAHLCKELGLVGDAWCSMGARWQALAILWLWAEEVLSSTACTNLTFLQIHKSTLHDDWKEWMNAKLMRTNMPTPAESFGKVSTDYLKGIQSSTLKQGGLVTSEIWCHPGRTGIVALLLCLYWQSVYSGARHDWEGNLNVIESIYNAILTSNL